MLKENLALIIIIIVSVSCKNNNSNSSTDSNTGLYNFIDENEENSITNQSHYYCKVKIGNNKYEADYDLISSNSFAKETMMTTFNITSREEIFEEFPLDLSFSKVHKTTSPKLVKGKYDLRTPTLEEQEALSFFSIGEQIITEKTYQNFITSNLINDIKNSYVLLSNENNEFNIQSIKDIGNVEESKYYTTGQQEIKGTATAYLLKVVNNERLTLKVDFNCLHEWTISKKMTE